VDYCDLEVIAHDFVFKLHQNFVSLTTKVIYEQSNCLENELVFIDPQCLIPYFSLSLILSFLRNLDIIK